jgi:hypothetical protein
MTMSTKAALTSPIDPTKNQVTESRRILAEMNDKADRVIDAQVAASTPMASKK